LKNLGRLERKGWLRRPGKMKKHEMLLEKRRNASIEEEEDDEHAEPETASHHTPSLLKMRVRSLCVYHSPIV
jgi:hypothetical protein